MDTSESATTTSGEDGAPDLAVGDRISLDGRRWTFSKGTAMRFDDHVGKSIPGYQDGHALIEEVSDFFVSNGGRVIEVGCSTGALISRLARRHAQVPAEFLGVDLVPEMVEVARERYREQENLRLETVDARRVDYGDASLVIMYYTLQFVPRWQRRSLLQRVCREIRPGGALILFEKTRLPSGMLQDICNQVYETHKLKAGFSAEEIIGKARSLRGILEPFTSAENAALIRDAGFGEPHVLYRQLAFEGTLSVKPVLADV